MLEDSRTPFSLNVRVHRNKGTFASSCTSEQMADAVFTKTRLIQKPFANKMRCSKKNRARSRYSLFACVQLSVVCRSAARYESVGSLVHTSCKLRVELVKHRSVSRVDTKQDSASGVATAGVYIHNLLLTTSFPVLLCAADLETVLTLPI